MISESVLVSNRQAAAKQWVREHQLGCKELVCVYSCRCYSAIGVGGTLLCGYAVFSFSTIIVVCIEIYIYLSYLSNVVSREAFIRYGSRVSTNS